MNILFIFPNIDTVTYKPVGLSTLAAVVKRQGHRARLFDTTFYETSGIHSNMVLHENIEVGEEICNFVPVDITRYNLQKEKVNLKGEFLKVLKEFKPDVICASVLSAELHVAISLSRLAKSYDANIFTIIGGQHCYADPYSAINEEAVDSVCIGEAEYALIELFDKLESGVPYQNTKNFWFKKNNKIIKNPLGNYVKPLDDLPFLDYSIYDERQLLRIYFGNVYRSGDYTITRGCPGTCTYCLNKTINDLYGDKTLRRYSVDRVIDELKYLKETYKLEMFRFQDATFLAIPQSYIEELSKKYSKHIGLPIIVDASPETVTDAKARTLKEMNCVSISIGVETGNEEYRINSLRKNVTNKQIIKAFDYLNKYGIRTVAFNMIGFPFETRKFIFDTIKLMRETRVKSPSIGFVYPFKGTPIRDTAIKYKLFDESIEKNNVPQCSRDFQAIRNPNISNEEYKGIFRTFIFYCKLPENMFNKISFAERFDKRGNEAFKECKEYYIEHDLYL